MKKARSNLNRVGAVLSISAVALGQAAAFSSRWELELDPRTITTTGTKSGRQGIRDRHVFVPYEHVPTFLGVTDGAVPGDPFPPPDVCGDTTVIANEDGLDLLDLVHSGLHANAQHLFAMIDLAREALDRDLTDEERAALDAAFEQHLEGIDEIGDSEFQGIYVFNGPDVCLEGVPIFVDLPEVNFSTLGLNYPTPNLDSPEEASSALTRIYHAMDYISCKRAEMRVADFAFRDGPAEGGLREQERLLLRMRELAKRAVLGNLGSWRRTMLYRLYEHDLGRLNAVARNVRFERIPVLRGNGRAVLQGPPPLGDPVVIELPAVDARGLGLEGTDLSYATGSMIALEAVDAAIERVAEHRVALREAWSELHD